MFNFAGLLPRDANFFNFFEEHARVLKKGVEQFVALCNTHDPARAPGNIALKARQIKEIEHEADILTHRCIETLHKTFITPIDRDSIYKLITQMDEVVDYVESTAERLMLYEITTMRPETHELSEILYRCTEHIAVAVSGLRNMKNAEPILEACVEINRLENEADSILRVALARLFKEEKDPITIIKWKEIFENLENATDSCEDVAQIIEGVVLESA